MFSLDFRKCDIDLEDAIKMARDEYKTNDKLDNNFFTTFCNESNSPGYKKLIKECMGFKEKQVFRQLIFIIQYSLFIKRLLYHLMPLGGSNIFPCTKFVTFYES